MNAIAMLMIGLSFAAAQADEEVEIVEQSIRNHYAGQGEVLQVEMRKTGADSMTGFASVRDEEGVVGRANCTAQRNQANDFAWNCRPDITEDMVQRLEQTIRAALAEQAEVLEVDLARQDDMRMTGRARLRTADGAEVRASCTATRADPDSRMFNWRCTPEQ